MGGRPRITYNSTERIIEPMMVTMISGIRLVFAMIIIIALPLYNPFDLLKQTFIYNNAIMFTQANKR